MKKNQKILGMLLMVVVLLCTMCVCKTAKTDSDSITDPKRTGGIETVYLSDSDIAKIDTTIVLYKTTNKAKEICAFQYVFRFESESGINDYKRFIQINNGPVTEITSNLANFGGGVTVNTGVPITIHIFSLKSPTSNPNTDTLFSAKCFDIVNTCGSPDIIIRAGQKYRNLGPIRSVITRHTSGPGSIIRQIITWPPSLTSQQYKP